MPSLAGAKHPGGRRAGKRPTRGAILAAARRLFASEGADGTTIRAVARAAGVDPALVMHYFGSKDGLFRAAIEWPIDMGEATGQLLAGDIDGLGERVVRFFLGLWEDEATRHPLEIIMRRSMQRQGETRLLTEFVHDQIISRVASVLSGPDGELRGSLAMSTLVGLAMARYVMRVPPLAQQSRDDVVAIVAPTLQRYLNGPLRLGSAT
jgi:AcrR family transcriptional regulator